MPYSPATIERMRIATEFMEKQKRSLAWRPRKPLIAVSYFDDHRQSRRLSALCFDCYYSIEPVRLATNEGGAGAVCCDWCKAINTVTS